MQVMWQTFVGSEKTARVYSAIDKTRLAQNLAEQSAVHHLLELTETLCGRPGMASHPKLLALKETERI